MKCGVVVFPGSNCDDDAVYVLSHIYGHDTVKLWHKDPDLQGCDFIVLPGGFAYGDYLRAGAIARFSPVMNSIFDFAANGGFVMGICNGFQVLCEAHLLPGVLLRNENQKFICKNIHIKAVTNNSPLTSVIPMDMALKIPIAHAEGRFFAQEDVLNKLEANDQVLFRYCNAQGVVTAEANPNGALNNIAGICNESRNVFGLMPHPERASDEVLGNTDGRLLFDSVFKTVLATNAVLK